MYRLKSFFGLGLLLISLAGCYFSDKPLISDDQAAFPFDPYAVVTLTDDSAHDSTTLVRKGPDYVAVDPTSSAKGMVKFRFVGVRDG